VSDVYNADAEMSVIGAALISEGGCIPEVLEHMASSDFYVPKHQTIFEACVFLHAQGSPVDATTVAIQLQTDGNLMRVGGAPFLVDCIQKVPTASNATYYAKSVAAQARMRKLDELCVTGRRLIAEGKDDPDRVMDTFQSLMDESHLMSDPGAQGFGDLYEEWVAWQHDDIRSLPTPWHDLNTILSGGLHRKRLYIFGARPGCGKSVMGLNIAERIAMAGYKVMVFSLEMPKMEVMSRILAAGARADYGEITRHEMSRATFESVNRYYAANPNFNSHIKIDDRVDHTIDSIAHAARAQKRYGLDFIFIDYVQLLDSSGKSESRYQELGLMSKLSKQLAGKLDIAVGMAAQLNRNPEQQNRLPNLSDLRESGNLEADADAVIMLSKGGDEEMPDLPLITVNVVKNRTGEMRMVNLPQHFEQARIGD
jgi:replicative DNA helicase